MAKVYDSDVDPDEFIRDFRQEPSGIGGLKKAPAVKGDVTSTPISEQPKEKIVSNRPKRNVCEEIDDGDEAYRRRFLLDPTYMWPQEKFQPVEIDPEFVQKIRRIISYEKKRPCTVKAYVNNVLAAHFEQYAAYIEKRL